MSTIRLNVIVDTDERRKSAKPWPHLWHDEGQTILIPVEMTARCAKWTFAIRFYVKLWTSYTKSSKLSATMPTDFSHITAALKAIGYRHAINRGDRVTDEMFHDAVSALSPPPLPDGLMAQLLEELDERIPRKPGLFPVSTNGTDLML